jgi:hypothetical protein
VVDALGETGASTAKPTEDFSQDTAVSSHSVAADPVGNQVYVPIKCTLSSCGPSSSPTICSAHHGDDTKGCIAVFTVTSGTDDPGSCFQQGGSFANCPPKGQNAQGNQNQNGQGNQN